MNPEAKEFNPSFLNTKASAPPSISVPKPKGSPRQDGPRRNQQQQQQQQQSSTRPPRATSSHPSVQRPVRSDGNYPAQRRESEANDEGAAFSRSPGHSGKKGKSLNHLLNFSFPERVQSLPPPRRVVRRQAYNKERYTHASFRFLVCDLDIYQSNITDPDNMVEWEHIEQVIVSNPQEQACPICLEEPKAARMTRCGHVFCFSCVLHYLALGEKSWRRCPICFDAVQATDLKSVRINRSIRYGEGDVLRLVLMERAKTGYVAFPRSSWSQAVAESVPCSDDPLAMRFSKLVRATPAKIEEILLDDLSVLEAQKLEAETSGEAESLPFIEQGIASVKQKVEEVRSSPLKRVTELLHQINQIPNREASKKARSHAEERSRSSPPAPAAAAATHSKYDRDFSLAKGKRMSVEEEELDEEEGTEESSERSSEVDSEDFEGGWETPFGPDEPPRFSEEEEEEEARTRSSQAQTKKEPEKVAKDARQAQGGPQAKEERGNRAEGKKKPPPAHHTAAAPQEGDPDFLYFYQAEDGQPLFCHPLITRILLTDRGSVASLPDVIEAKIVEMEEMSQNDETRKRFKTTAHLPLTTEFSLCEVDLRTGNLISAETQRTFQPELQQREQRRKSKARKERLKDKQKQRDDINNFDRYQRFLDSYAESFPSISSDDSFKPSEEELSSLSEFPEPSRGGAASTSPEAAPAAAAAARPPPKASPPAGSSPTKQHNYATALRVGPGEKPLFSEDDFAPMLSSSSSVPRNKTKGFAAPSSSAGTASLSMDETSFPVPSSSSLAAKKAGPWGAPAKGGESFASVIQKQAPPAGPPQPEGPEEEPKQGGRKDKKKKMVLMSTNLRRY